MQGFNSFFYNLDKVFASFCIFKYGFYCNLLSDVILYFIIVMRI